MTTMDVTQAELEGPESLALGPTEEMQYVCRVVPCRVVPYVVF